MYLNTPYKIQYNTREFPFRETVMQILQEDSLENLHKSNKIELLTREKDQSTPWHKDYYNNFNEQFYPLYLKFVEHLKDRLGYESIIYQKIPTFRVQQVGNLGVGEWHKDKTYNHGTSEVNFWLPFVNTYRTNTVWVESKEDLGDYQPMNVNYGEVLVFNGANLMHGNKINEEETSRVSIDFRLVDPAKFKPTEAGSINMKTPFNIGGYFEKL